MRVLLAYKSRPEAGKDSFTTLMPIGLGYIHAYLREAGFDSSLANLSEFSWRQIEEFLRTEQPALLGISMFTHNRLESLRIATIAKRCNPACCVVLGGPHATHRYEALLRDNPSVDAVVLGEGEQTFLEIARLLQKRALSSLVSVAGIACRGVDGIFVTPDRRPITELDSLPFPGASYGQSAGCDIHRQMEFIITSRGCPSSCTFCSSPRFWGSSLRFRSPRSMVEEIVYLRDRYGLIYFSLRDDTFTTDRQRVIDFCRLLLAEKVFILWNCQSRVNFVDGEMLAWMKRAGCECVQYGVESGSEKILRLLGKKIRIDQIERAARLTRENGIHLSIYLIAGVPGEEMGDLEATCALIRRIRPHDGQVSPLVYYPGTSLFASAVASGAVPGDLFEAEKGESFPVRTDDDSARAVRKLLRELELGVEKNRYRARDFLAHKKQVGYCHAANIMAGEYFEETGDSSAAEKEYREIVRREPENPWGVLSLGEFYGRQGRYADAEKLFRRLTALLPHHAPAFAAIGELRMLAGDRKAAERWYRKTLELNPCEPTAQQGIEMIAR